MRAISLRTARSRPWLSSWPVAAWKRRLNSSIFASTSLPSSSSSVEFRRSAATMPLAITPHHPLGAPGGCPPGQHSAFHEPGPWLAQHRGACAGWTSRLAHFAFHELAPWLAQHRGACAGRTSRLAHFAFHELAPWLAQHRGACAGRTSRLAHFAFHEFAFHRELVHGTAECLPGDRLGHPGQLEHHPAWLDVGDPPFRCALARAHPGLGRLLGQRPVRVDVDPHLPATADVPRHGDTGGLDLPVGHVGMLDGLDAVLAEGHPGTALGRTRAIGPVLLAVPYPARDEHASALLARGCWYGRLRGLVLAFLAGFRGPVRARPAGSLRPPATSGRPPLLLQRPAWPLPSPQRRGRGLALGPGLRRLAAVYPDLHADPAEGGPCLVEAVVNVSAERVQRDPALAVELRPGHLRAAQPARALHPDALGAALHRGLHGLAHGTAERDPAGELLGYSLGDKLRVDLRVLDLEDVELDLLTGQLLQVTADPVGLGAAAADDDARAGRVDVHPYPVPGPLDP